jgi:hypothetical protein
LALREQEQQRRWWRAAGAALAQGALTLREACLLLLATALRGRLTAAPEWAELVPPKQARRGLLVGMCAQLVRCGV